MLKNASRNFELVKHYHGEESFGWFRGAFALSFPFFGGIRIITEPHLGWCRRLFGSWFVLSMGALISVGCRKGFDHYKNWKIMKKIENPWKEATKIKKRDLEDININDLD